MTFWKNKIFSIKYVKSTMKMTGNEYLQRQILLLTFRCIFNYQTYHKQVIEFNINLRLLKYFKHVTTQQKKIVLRANISNIINLFAREILHTSAESVSSDMFEILSVK